MAVMTIVALLMPSAGSALAGSAEREKAASEVSGVFLKELGEAIMGNEQGRADGGHQGLR
jgi:hypothetical protein